MITAHNRFPPFNTADEYYHAAMKYQASGHRINSEYLAHLWEKFDELHVMEQPVIDLSMRNQY